MTNASHVLTDRLLLRATVTPGRRPDLRVVVLHQREPGHELEQQGFTDASSAAAFVQTWLEGLEQRWEQGERSHGRREE
ncbi:MAG: hypothetical protein KC461_09000 [Dehalococcoidia bacterium]|nr:hypothetical protein [Dehalococcoidia bacterium]MCA9850763.1 hypothetical protein [Dehalococcoidia bacterium]